jgi:hypothetical protein
MSKIATIAASILLAFSAVAAGTTEQPVAKKQVSTVTVSAPAAEHDYKLERESCCGPQHE